MSRRPSEVLARWRQIIVLKRAGLRIADIAEALDRPTNSVTYGLKRARELGL